MVARHHVNEVNGPKVVGEIVDVLDQLAREGARLLLERALSAEVNEFLGRQRYAAAMSFAVAATATAGEVFPTTRRQRCCQS